MAQDDYYYEIQLTNKQLVFYFMAGADRPHRELSRGRDGRPRRRPDAPRHEAAQAAHALAEDRIVPEESPTTTKPRRPPPKT